MEFRTLYQELIHSTEMIRAMLKGIDQEQSQVKPDAKSWSILEVVCHLHDEEREDFRENLDFILHRQYGASISKISPAHTIFNMQVNGRTIKYKDDHSLLSNLEGSSLDGVW